MDSKIIFFIVGLPGAGKSTLGRLLAAEKGVPFLDDLSTTHGRQALLDVLQNDTPGCVIADVYLCEAPAREAAARLVASYCPTAVAVWKYFENTEHGLEKCRRNVRRRQEAGDSREVDGSLARFSKSYTIPKGAEILIVYDDTTDTDIPPRNTDTTTTDPTS